MITPQQIKLGGDRVSAYTRDTFKTRCPTHGATFIRHIIMCGIRLNCGCEYTALETEEGDFWFCKQ